MRTTARSEAASRYHETVSRTRRLVPFVEVSPGDGRARWTFLGDRQRAAERPQPPTAQSTELPTADDPAFGLRDLRHMLLLAYAFEV